MRWRMRKEDGDLLVCTSVWLAGSTCRCVRHVRVKGHRTGRREEHDDAGVEDGAKVFVDVHHDLVPTDAQIVIHVQ